MGVRGVALFEPADEGRGIALVEIVCVVVFISFVGRVGEPFLCTVGDGGFNFVGVDGVVGGVALIAEEAFNAARCGRGLIGLVFLSATDCEASGLRCSFPPSSSDDELGLRRAPTLAG